MWTLVRSAKLPWALLVLGGLAVGLWLRYAEPQVVYQPGPSSTQFVHKTKWRDKIRTRLVPVNATIEFLQTSDVEQQLKTKAPDNVTAVGDVPPHTGKTTVISHLVEREGVLHGELTFKQQPPPFFKLQRVVGLRTGYGTPGVVGEVFVQPLRVGPTFIEGRLYTHSDPSDFGAVVLIEYRF